MKRLLFTGLSALVLNSVLVPAAFANEFHVADSYTTVFDARERMTELKSGEPPSGDSNPSDQSNRTVSARDIITPQR